MRKQGLYDPAFEHDACGVAFVARLDGSPQPRGDRPGPARGRESRAPRSRRRGRRDRRRSRDPRSASRCIPARVDRLRTCRRSGGTASRFASCRGRSRAACGARAVARAHRRGAKGRSCSGGATSRSNRVRQARTHSLFAPVMRQLFVGAADELGGDLLAFERKLYVIRRVAERQAGSDLVIPSFSARTLVYKGMLTAPQLRRYFPDLADERLESALALVHSRFSTNTFPSWELAHPYRMIAHNGEINTLRGNVNWIRARESQLASELFGSDMAKLVPVIRPAGSDTAVFDNVLELLVLSGRSLPHALMMMVPEAYGGRADVSDELRGLLPLPRMPDRGLGWSSRDRVHRRDRDRRDARPERPAARALARDDRRLGRARLGDRRARYPGRSRPAQGPAAARKALSRRSRPGSHRP